MSLSVGTRVGTYEITSLLGAGGAYVLLGTAAYRSPEQARGKPVDTRSDIWAFGSRDGTIMAAAVISDRDGFDAAVPDRYSAFGRCGNRVTLGPQQRTATVSDERVRR